MLVISSQQIFNNSSSCFWFNLIWYIISDNSKFLSDSDFYFLNSFFEFKLSISIKLTLARYKSFRFCNCTQGICFKSKTTFCFGGNFFLTATFQKFLQHSFTKSPFLFYFFGEEIYAKCCRLLTVNFQSWSTLWCIMDPGF